MSETSPSIASAPSNPPSSTASPAPEGKKTLSNKELKELKKKEKLLRRQKSKVGSPSPHQSEKSSKSNPKSNEGNSKSGKQSQSKIVDTNVVIKNQTPFKPQAKGLVLFGHLHNPETKLDLSPLALAKVIHPAILKLALKISTYSIVGSIQRCKEMLITFKDVINDYFTPHGTTLSRNLTAHLSHQIDYLKLARPLSVPMGNAIRWLKQRISKVSIDKIDSEAKSDLCNDINSFINEKIELAGRVIVETANEHIHNGSTVLTFSNSTVLKDAFIHAHKEQEKDFTVIIVDSRPLFEGKQLLKELVGAGVKCVYVLITSLASILDGVDTVFLGAHSMLSNGRLYARVGTALVAMTATNRNIPVLVCSESIKFSEKVQLDSVTMNELGDPDDIAIIGSEKPNKKGYTLAELLKQPIAAKEELPKQKKNQNQNQNNNNNSKVNKSIIQQDPLGDYEQIDGLNILNLMYDLTPPEYIKKVITEWGSSPASSVPVILREYNVNKITT